ncbi:MAG: Xaa-Pro peptidase family protein [Deltaproteobacteria bacterium]|nr:Xaa-Pro peptidase family protein [Deltaproteobacteria bacterium]
MFTPGERLPLEELLNRHARCRALLAKHAPSAGGILVTGTPNLYYMTGTAANGLAWLPLEGDMVLAVRKGRERARLESPLASIVTFRSYKELAGLCADAGSPLTPTLAADQSGVSWEQGRMLLERMPERTVIPGDAVIARTRAVKSEWELAKMRESCSRINSGYARLAGRIHPGMSEYDIARVLWDIFLSMGHTGSFPTGLHGSMITLGHIDAGESGNYPSAYDGPLGVKGAHPSSPSMGSRHAVWQKGEVLAVDSGFNFEGYISDKTQIFFAGEKKDIPADVRKAQDTAMLIAERTAAALKPGASPAAVYALSLDIAKQAGYAATFMGYGENQVRFLGHGIGLTVSEWPIFAWGFDEPLQPGMTVALEPKIALPGIAMVGIENTYEITESGARSLTGEIAGIVCVR